MAQSHTPRNRCVRFVFGVTAASRNTRFQAVRYDLTWTGLAPADRASFAWRLPSFDHLIGSGEQRGRDREADGLGGLEIDDQFESSGLRDRQVGGFRSLEDFPRINAGLPICIGLTASVADQAAGFYEFA